MTQPEVKILTKYKCFFLLFRGWTVLTAGKHLQTWTRKWNS